QDFSPSPPIFYRHFRIWQQNGRSSPNLLDKLRELWAERPLPPHHLAKLEGLWAKTAVPHPISWINFVNGGQNGRFQ
ncbi:MAG: hypothetical protein IAF02_19385, partial [Anaerolineae bacterium]|nr:hypothetical protein [Anaerolineae bacterium]